MPDSTRKTAICLLISNNFCESWQLPLCLWKNIGMIVETSYVEIPTDASPMRAFVAMPRAAGHFPAILCYSDIFQLTGPMLRFCVRLAGYGFIAVAPEIYHRIEPAGTAIPFDDAGRTRGLEDAGKTPVADFDKSCRAGLDWLSKHSKVARGKVG